MSDLPIVTSDQFKRHRLGKLASPWGMLIIGILLLLLCAVLVSLFSGKDSNPAAPAGVKITPQSKIQTNIVIDGSMQPATVTVKAGTTVTWQNKNESLPQLAARTESGTQMDGFGTDEALGLNDSYSYVFERPGTYNVYDKLNPQLNVTITVQ